MLLACVAIARLTAPGADASLLRMLDGGVWAAGFLQLLLAPIAVSCLTRDPTARNALNYTLTFMGVLGAVLFLRMCWLTFHA